MKASEPVEILSVTLLGNESGHAEHIVNDHCFIHVTYLPGNMIRLKNERLL